MEEKKEIGSIESITTHTTKKDGTALRSPRYEISVNGKRHSTFSGPMIDGIKVGDVVELSLNKEPTDQYWQLSEIRLIEEGNGQDPVQPSVPQTPQPNVQTNPQYLETPKKTVKHMVLSDMGNEEFRSALNVASEQFDVFATQSHVENGKWYALIFIRD